MADFNNVKIFGDTSLSDLFKQIHKNNKDIDKQIEGLIKAMVPLAQKDAGSAVMLMPTVKDLLDVNVKNNDQLVKMAGIVQRAAASDESNKNNDDFFNSIDIQQLIEEQKQLETKLLEIPAPTKLLDK